MTEYKQRYVVVTTDKDRRGVFFGVFEKQEGDVVALWDAQMAVYYAPETHGVLGLASIGPQKGSRISPIVPHLEVDGVTAVMDCTDEAVKKWREQPWD